MVITSVATIGNVTNTECLFCRIVAREIPATVVYETDRILAFRDISPAAPVHVLVIPKEHHSDLTAIGAADPGLAGEVVAAASRVAELEGLLGSGYRVIVNSGPDAGQIVFHVHAHVLGGTPLGPLRAPDRQP